MKKLRVWWQLYSMDSVTAKKLPPKRYKKIKHFTDFDEDTNPHDAIGSIIEEHGQRPEGAIHVAHKFAVIVDHRLVNPFVREPEPLEQFEEQNLLSSEELEKCKKTKDESRPW